MPHAGGKPWAGQAHTQLEQEALTWPRELCCPMSGHCSKCPAQPFAEQCAGVSAWYE